MKIGDKVIIIESPYGSLLLAPGNTGVITSQTRADVFKVLMDNGHQPSHKITPDDDWSFLPEWLEVLE